MADSERFKGADDDTGINEFDETYSRPKTLPGRKLQRRNSLRRRNSITVVTGTGFATLDTSSGPVTIEEVKTALETEQNEEEEKSTTDKTIETADEPGEGNNNASIDAVPIESNVTTENETTGGDDEPTETNAPPTDCSGRDLIFLFAIVALLGLSIPVVVLFFGGTFCVGSTCWGNVSFPMQGAVRAYENFAIVTVRETPETGKDTRHPVLAVSESAFESTSDLYARFVLLAAFAKRHGESCLCEHHLLVRNSTDGERLTPQRACVVFVEHSRCGRWDFLVNPKVHLEGAVVADRSGVSTVLERSPCCPESSEPRVALRLDVVSVSNQWPHVRLTGEIEFRGAAAYCAQSIADEFQAGGVLCGIG